VSSATSALSPAPASQAPSNQNQPANPWDNDPVVASADDAKAQQAPDQKYEDMSGGQRALSDAQTLVDTGAAFVNGRTLGLGPKVASAVGSTIADPVLRTINAFTDKTTPSWSDLYKSGVDMYSAPAKALDQQHPVVSFLANVAGGAKTFGQVADTGAAQAVGDFLSPSIDTSTLAGKAANLGVKALQGSAVGAGTGAIYGAGNAAPGQEAQGATHGAEIGSILGPVGTLAGEAIGAGSSLASSVRNRITSPIAQRASAIANTIETNNPAEADIVKQVLARPDADQIIQQANSRYAAAQNSGIPITLAEAIGDPDMMAKAGQLAIKPQTKGQALSFFNGRLDNASNAIQRMGDTISPESSVDEASTVVGGSAQDAINKIYKNMQDQAAPLYQQAYQANKAMETPGINRIINTPAGQTAFQRALVTMQNQMKNVGVSDPELTAQGADAGIVTGKGIAPGLKLEFLDQVKRELDGMAGEAMNAGNRNQTRVLSGLASNLRDELDNADVTAKAGPNSLVPEGGLYKQARAIYAGNAQEDLPKIQKYLGPLADSDLYPKQVIDKGFSATPQATQTIAENIGPDASTALAKGKYLQTVGNLDEGNPLALAGKLKTGAPDVAAKWQTLLGPDKYSQFQDLMGTLRTAQEGSSFIPSKGSLTNIRTSAGDILDNAGKIPTSLGDAAKKAANGVLSIFSKAQTAEYQQNLSDVMFSPRGQALLDKIQNAGTPQAKTNLIKSLGSYLNDTLPGGTMTLSKPGDQTTPATAISQPQQHSENLMNKLGIISPAYADEGPAPTQPNNLLDKMQVAESGRNPDAKNPNSSASGPYQFTNQTWRDMVNKYGDSTGIKYADKADPDAQRTMASLYARDNANQLASNLGRDPSPGEVYMAHVFGPNGAEKLINATGTGAKAKDIFPANVVRANRNLFFDKVRPRSASEVYDLLDSKVS
jgi:hypothetical protein